MPLRQTFHYQTGHLAALKSLNKQLGQKLILPSPLKKAVVKTIKMYNPPKKSTECLITHIAKNQVID